MTNPVAQPTREVHPTWIVGSGGNDGDKWYLRPGVVAHLCLVADREVTWVFAPPLPVSMAEAIARVA